MCGIVALTSEDSAEATHDLAGSLEGLKHRGSDSFGALLYYDGALQNSVRGRKITPNALDQIRLMRPDKNVMGRVIATGHTRYTTSNGKNLALNSHPYTVAHHDLQMEVAFNGNIPNHERIRRDHLDHFSFATRGDTETLSRFMFDSIERILLEPGQPSVKQAIRETVRKVFDIFPGRYSVIARFDTETFAFKDPYGTRPMAYGVKECGVRPEGHIFASENHFFPKFGYDTIGEVPNGSLVFPGEDPLSLLSEHISAQPDVFEFVYLAKDASELWGVRNNLIRFDLGVSAAQELQTHHPDWHFDTVVAVPNGANIMRQGVCQVYGLDASQKNAMQRKEYSDRSFMAPEQSEREKIVRDKFMIDGNAVYGKKILLVDDSIVRGTTMKVIVDILLELGALSVTVLSCSPIVHYGDRFGIAMSTNELVGIDHTDGRKLSCEDIEMKLFFNGYTGQQKARLFYPSVEKFLGVFQKHGLSNVHAAYFDGKFING